MYLARSGWLRWGEGLLHDCGSYLQARKIEDFLVRQFRKQGKQVGFCRLCSAPALKMRSR